MWPFTKKVNEKIPVFQTPDETFELMEASTNSSMQQMMDREIKQQIVGGYTFAPMEDESNFFNQEFNIKPTITRLKTAYSQEPWMFACVQTIARAMSVVDFEVKDKYSEEVLKDHPLAKQLKAGNVLQDETSLEWAGYSDLILSGNFFRVFDSTYQTSMHVPIETVDLKMDDAGRVTHIEIYKQNSHEKQIVDANHFIHYKLANPFTPYWGMSPFTSLARPILLDRYKNEYETAFYLRGCAKAGVIETDVEYSKSKLARLMTTFEQVFSGKRNWWRPIFLPKGAKWIANAANLTEMQHLEGLRENRRTILAVMGIPPSQVGIIEDVNRATSETQSQVFYENTISPYVNFIAAGWNNSYLVKSVYGGRVEVVANYSNVPALQESLKSKGEQAEAIKNYFLIDEIREKIFGEEPLPNGQGDKFVVEVGKASQDFSLFDLSMLQQRSQTPRDIKSVVIEDQERAERSYLSRYKSVVQKITDTMLSQVVEALKKRHDVADHLVRHMPEITELYKKEGVPLLIRALERGFAFALERMKDARRETKAISTIDREAIDYLREETRAGKRTAFEERAIRNFLGFSQTRSREILDVIANGLEEGLTLDQIAADIRQNYGQRYQDQAFTVARTEVLGAISQGIKWNQEILSEVFTEVRKQWFHVGDVGANPDARENHFAFDQLGEVSLDYEFSEGLTYPRDPNAAPGETINCRCTLINVIPKDAQSNAESILL